MTKKSGHQNFWNKKVIRIFGMKNEINRNFSRISEFFQKRDFAPDIKEPLHATNR